MIVTLAKVQRVSLDKVAPGLREVLVDWDVSRFHNLEMDFLVLSFDGDNRGERNLRWQYFSYVVE